MIQKKRYLGKAATILAVLFVMASTLAAAPTPTPLPTDNQPGSIWSRPVNLGRGWFPDIAADQTGRVHVVWAASHSKNEPVTVGTPTPQPGHGGFDVVMYNSTDNGNMWNGANDIAAIMQTAGSEVTRPSLLTDSKGFLHMTYRGLNIYYTQTQADQAANPLLWQAPYPMNDLNQVAYFSRLALDSHGIIHMVLTENDPSKECEVCYHLYYRKSGDGITWSFLKDISILPTGAVKPQILVDNQDTIHVVWEAGRGGAYGQLSDPTTTFYVASYDGGDTWSQPLEMSAGSSQAKDITIGQDGFGSLVVVWLQVPEDQVYYRISHDHGRTWSSPAMIPDVWGGWSFYQARLDDYSMAVDSAGHLHLAMVGRTDSQQKDLNVLHLTWGGFTWSKPDVVVTLKGDVPEWPRLAVSTGNQLEVVWFVRDQANIFNSDKGNYFVWSSHSTVTAPARPAKPWPTATPTSTLVPTRVIPTRTPIVLPEEAKKTPLDPNLVESFRSEKDNYLTIALALLPPTVFILVVFGLVILKRRK